jgi:type I restriction enzyme, S subunit
MNQDRSSTITNSQLKEGYKQTEVGIIPEDWSATNLGKFMMLQRGYDLPHRERKIGDIPIITSSGFGGTHSESRALAPGVVTGRYGTIGDVFYIQEDFWPLNTTLYVKNFYGNNPLFASYLLKTIDFHSHSGKSGVPGVNRNDLHELIVSIPPIAEQEAIACTLSDIDALIESLDRLLTKKRQIKQGAMQELLTEKRRLPEFSCEWKTELLTNLVQSHNAGVYKGRELYGEGCKIIGVSDIYGINAVADQEFDRVPLTREEINQYSLEENDLVYGESSLVREGIARTVYVTSKGGNAFAWHTRRFKVFQNILNSRYLYYYLQSQAARKHMMENSIQTAITGINTTAYFACPIAIPSIDEQIEIANILSDMDAEIDSIESKLTKTRQLKQGMMHELLTGKIRLVSNS